MRDDFPRRTSTFMTDRIDRLLQRERMGDARKLLHKLFNSGAFDVYAAPAKHVRKGTDTKLAWQGQRGYATEHKELRE